MTALVDTRSQYASLEGLYYPIALVVIVAVFGLTLFALIHFRRREGRAPSTRSDAPLLEGSYVVGLVVIVVVLVVATFTTEGRVDAVAARPALRVNVTASDWRWRFDYPTQHVSELPGPMGVTDLVVPVGQTVEFDMTSLDVIHAFWIPDRRFQREAFPDRTTRFDLVFDHPGAQLAAQCNEFCGLGHSDMRFVVRTLTAVDFARWASRHAPSATARAPVAARSGP